MRLVAEDGHPPAIAEREQRCKVALGAAGDEDRGVLARDLGDLGFEDAGEMPREVLEREVEAVLFSLKPGEVSAPVDSPRGYYVFRRIE